MFLVYLRFMLRNTACWQFIIQGPNSHDSYSPQLHTLGNETLYELFTGALSSSFTFFLMPPANEIQMLENTTKRNT